MSEGYDNNNRGSCWPAEKALSGYAEIEHRKFDAVLARTNAKAANAPTHNLYLRARDKRSEVYCVAIFKSTKGGEKLAGGELAMTSGASFWVSLFKNKSEKERAPIIDLSFQAKEAQPQSEGPAPDDQGPDEWL
jgi:hypothetical protein